MYRLITALLLITIIISCKKEAHQPEPSGPIDLLTSGKWVLVAYGWDDDSSGNIEAHENMILECQKDNTTQYFPNGNGQTRDNQVACNGNNESDFEWKFIDAEKAIEVLYQRYDIRTLSKTELYLVVQIPYLVTPLHIKYRK